MSWARAIRAVLVTLATAGLILPGEVLRGSEPERTVDLANQPIPDVQLDAAGQLHGVIVDGQGHALPETRVMLRESAIVPTRISLTDAKGHFTLTALKGGTYQLHTSEGVCVCRVWTAKAAPPAAGAVCWSSTTGRWNEASGRCATSSHPTRCWWQRSSRP